MSFSIEVATQDMLQISLLFHEQLQYTAQKDLAQKVGHGGGASTEQKSRDHNMRRRVLFVAVMLCSFAC